MNISNRKRRKRKKMANEFSKIFGELSRHRSFGSVFDDFLLMVLCGLSHGEEEDKYLEVMKRYEGHVEPKRWGEALGALMSVYIRDGEGDGWCDPLGELFEENGSKKGKQWSGQFFTPESVSDICAKMVGYEVPNYGAWVGDPACGSGRMLMSFSRLSPSHQLNPFYVGMDIDSLCVKMCAVNMFFHGMRGVVVHGNTLSLEVWGGYKIFPLMGKVKFLSADEARVYVVYEEKESGGGVSRFKVGEQIEMFS